MPNKSTERTRQCPHCQAEDIAAGTPSKVSLSRPKLNRLAFINHLVRQHQSTQDSADKLFTRLTTTVSDIADWLIGLKCTEVVPVIVAIGNEKWTGCRYNRTLEYTADMDAVRDGRHKAGDKYTENRIYVTGKLPGAKRHGDKVCFPFEGKDWYVAGYYQGNDPKYDEYHPFGVNFILAPWDVPNSMIDEYEPKPYKRIDMAVNKA